MHRASPDERGQPVGGVEVVQPVVRAGDRSGDDVADVQAPQYFWGFAGAQRQQHVQGDDHVRGRGAHGVRVAAIGESLLDQSACVVAEALGLLGWELRFAAAAYVAEPGVALQPRNDLLPQDAGCVVIDPP